MTTMEERESELARWLMDEKREYSIIDNDGMTHFLIEGFTYVVNVYIYEDRFEVGTTHKLRYKNDPDNNLYDSNAREIKKPSTLFSYIDKYCDL